MTDRCRRVDPHKLEMALKEKRWDLDTLFEHLAPQGHTISLRTLAKMARGEDVLRREVKDVEKVLGLTPGSLDAGQETTEKPPGVNATNRITLYWAAPHSNHSRNSRVCDALEAEGYLVKLPESIVQNAARADGRKPDSATIRKLCISAIEQSQCLIVDLDRYGLDSAWEIGYAEANGLRILGLTQDPGGSLDERRVNRRRFDQNFMHGWQNRFSANSMSELFTRCKDKTVYVGGSFKNDAAMNAIRRSNLSDYAKNVIIPKDEITRDLGIPSDREISWKASFKARQMAVDLLRDSDVVIVLLPNYGMDTAWQIGYAEGHGIEVFGLHSSHVSGPDHEDLPFWAHWMHNWESKLTVTSLEILIAVLNGFRQRELFPKASFRRRVA